MPSELLVNVRGKWISAYVAAKKLDGLIEMLEKEKRKKPHP